jgi:hypothetical protein
MSSTQTKVRAKCVTPKVSYQLLRGEKLVGLVLASSSCRWRVYDLDGETRLGAELFLSPQSAAGWAQWTGLGV